MTTPQPLTRHQVAELLVRRKNWANTDFRGLDLSGLCFDRTDLTRAKFADCVLTNASFRAANLSQASLWGANCCDVVFDDANLTDCDLDLSELHGASFWGAQLARTLFPLDRVSLDQIHTSVRTGKPIDMPPHR